MKKTLFIAVLAIVALASCSENDFVGDTPSPNSNNDIGAISFGTGVNTVTRAEKTGQDAATLLNSNFVFAGTKGTNPTTFVFDQYTAHFENNSANSTESNSSNWEYVGYEPASTSSLGLSGDNLQTIKYWDYATTQYDFAAYSLGSGSADASAINASTKSFTLTGSADDLKACYISDLVTYYNYDGGTANDATDDVSDYGKPVKFSFRSLAAKIRIAFYETIPGYSVKNVQFYSTATGGTAVDDPTLFTSQAVLPSGSGTMTITYETTGWSNKSATDYNKAHVSFAQASGVSAASTLSFGVLTNYPTANLEGLLTSTDGNFIGRTSNTATYADGVTTSGDPEETTSNAPGTYYTILPYETGANLQLRIKYTLVSTDKSGETITVDNATAVVPAELAKWSPNYAYTYIFKIGDMTNGSTGVDGSGNIVTGLTPITLDAVVVDSEDGVQETITTVSEPSITTYMAGKVITDNDEYITGKPIYIIVNNGTSNEELTVGTNAYLYTVTLQDGAAQTITEESVDNALTNGTYNSTDKNYTVTDAKGKELVVTESNLLTASTKIEAGDSPTGNEITIGTNKVAKFTPAAAGTTYVFKYTKGEVSAVYEQATGKYVAGTTYYTDATGTTTVDPTGFEEATDVGSFFVYDSGNYVQATGTYVAGTTYYEDATGGSEVDTSSFKEGTDVSSYFVLKTPASAAQKAYKIIKIQAANQGGGGNG